MAVAPFRAPGLLVPIFLLLLAAASENVLAQPVATVMLCGDGDGNIGTNWVSLPTLSDMTSAEDLCLSIPGALTVAQGVTDSAPNPSRRWSFDCATGACTSTQPVPEPGCAASTCFCIAPGEGIEVVTAAATPWGVNQCDRFDSITLPAGFRSYLVSVPYDTFLLNANDLAEHIFLPNTGITRGTVTRITCATGLATTCQAGTAACESLLIEPGQAYRVTYPSATGGLTYLNPVSCAAAAPGAAECPIGDLTFSSADTFSWTAPDGCPLPLPLVYDSMRGDLACLRGACRQAIPALMPPCAGCTLLEDDDDDTTTLDAATPALGVGWWYHSRVDGGTWRDPVAAACIDRDVLLAAGCP